MAGRAPALQLQERRAPVAQRRPHRQARHLDGPRPVGPPGRGGTAAARPEIDAEALRAQAAAIRRNLNEMASDQILGMVTKEQFHAASATGQKRLDEIAAIEHAVVDSPLKPLIGARTSWRRGSR